MRMGKNGKNHPQSDNLPLQTRHQVVQMWHLLDPWRAKCENHYVWMNTFANRQIDLIFRSNITCLSGFLVLLGVYQFHPISGCIQRMTSESPGLLQSADCCCTTCTTFKVGLVQAIWNSLVPVKRPRFGIGPVCCWAVKSSNSLSPRDFQRRSASSSLQAAFFPEAGVRSGRQNCI